MAATVNGSTTDHSMLVVARRVPRATAELIAMTSSDVPIAAGIGRCRITARAGTMTKPPPTPNTGHR